MSKKTVVITGVSRGLGRALALELAKKGHTIIGCARSQNRLDSLQLELSQQDQQQQPSNHLFLNADVRSNSDIQEFVRIVLEKKGIPDIIGTINRNHKIWEVPAEEFDDVIDTNIKGVANVLRHFLPRMVENQHGIIVNLSSSWGRSVAAEVSPYCASKWAVEGLTRSVAKELPLGMAIVAVSPGVVNTEMLQSCFGSSASLYMLPEAWAPRAAMMILNLTQDDNGASLTVC